MGAQLQQKGRGGAGGGRRRSYRPMSDINVTPFVDVMLVLLIVFMVTAPLLSAGVKIDLPQSKAKAVADEDNKPLEISITSDGVIYIGETKVKRGQLIDLLSAMTNNPVDRRVFIRGDRNLNYGMVMEIMGDLNAAGFRKIALLSDPTPKK